MSNPVPTTDDPTRTLHRLALVLNEKQVSYALIGGLCVAFRGTIRATQDVDLLIQIPQLSLSNVLEALVQSGFQLDVITAIQNWNRDHLLDFKDGSIRVDWLKPILPAFSRVLDRARWEQVGGQQIRIADAEGLVLLKLLAFRVRDQEDIKGILAANPARLDLDWVRQEWRQLSDKDDPKTDQFEQLVRDYYVADVQES